MHKQSPADMYAKQTMVRRDEGGKGMRPVCRGVSSCVVNSMIGLQLDKSAGALVCEAELQRRPAYVYRWDLPPIECCPGRGLN
jgi:hypothetical protein